MQGRFVDRRSLWTWHSSSVPGDPLLTIRRAIPDDHSKVTSCVEDAYGPYIEAMEAKPAPMLDDYERLIAQGRVWVAETDQDFAGIIVMWPKEDHWYVDNIAVCPQFQGSGVGSALLEFAEESARQAAKPEIRLYTNEAMTANTGYYPNRGFVETHRAIEHGYRRIFYSRQVRPK